MQVQSNRGIYPTDDAMQNYKRQLAAWAAAVHSHNAGMALLKVASGMPAHSARLEGGLGGTVDWSICRAVVTDGKLPLEVMLVVDPIMVPHPLYLQ